MINTYKAKYIKYKSKYTTLVQSRRQRGGVIGGIGESQQEPPQQEQ